MRWIFYCFLVNIFQITFKCLQNIVRLCFHFVKFSWEKYNMLRADEDGRNLFLYNELLVYIFKCKWNRETEKPHNFWTQIFNFDQYNHKNHCCNVSLNIIMKLWKYSMVNVLNCPVFFFLQIWKQWKKWFRNLQLQCVRGLFQNSENFI